MLKCPCKLCQERHYNCHSNCEKYERYRETIDKLKSQYGKDDYACYMMRRSKKGVKIKK